jgi:hypothetical protein
MKAASSCFSFMGFTPYDHFDSRLSPEGRDHETFPEGEKKGHAVNRPQFFRNGPVLPGWPWNEQPFFPTTYLWITMFMLLEVGR